MSDEQQPFTVQRLRDGWAIVYRDQSGTRRRHRLHSADRIGAEAEARQRWRLGARGEWTVGRIVNDYIDARADAKIASTDRQRDAWKAMAPYWDDVRPHLIDEPMCRAYAMQRRAGAATIRYELSMLGVALRHAHAAKHIADAPMIWRPAAPECIDRALTRDQFRRFLDAVKAPHARLYMILGLATCARPSALLELTWDRVDFDRGTINLNPVGRIQSAKRRPVVPIADYALQPLLDAHAGRQSAFVIERGGKQVASIKKAFAAAAQRSGVHATPYTLRHSGLVWRAEDGVPMTELAQLAGHDDDRTTQKHYARFSPTHLRKAANAGGW